MSKSYVFWIVLGVMWSITFLFRIKEASPLEALLITGLAAVICYVLALILMMKQKKENGSKLTLSKEDDKEV